MTNLKTANAVYLGSHRADSVRLGPNLVWSRPLPPFPAAPILDNFNRANELPLSASNWTTAFAGDPYALQVIGNQVASSGAGFGSQAWKTAYQIPFDTYFTWVSSDTDFAHFWVLDDSSLSHDLLNVGDPVGYQLSLTKSSSPTKFELWRVDVDDNWTQLVNDRPPVPPFAVGDSYGLRIKQGGVIEVWRKPAAGVWSLYKSVIDPAPHPGPFHPAVELHLAHLDDVGGGAV